MTMNDWKNEVETSLKLLKYKSLDNKGKISKKQAEEKALNEYEKYKVIQDKNYISDFDLFMQIESKVDENK